MDHIDWVRSPEELFSDLAKALEFRPSLIYQYRKGRLPMSQTRVLLKRILKPLAESAAFTLGPLFLAAYYTAMSSNISLSDGLLQVFGFFMRPWEYAEIHGWLRTVLGIKAALASLGAGVYYATKIPIDLAFDIMAGRVKCSEGRVTVREEEKRLPGRRDESPFYYFEMKERSFEVSREAFRAIDPGGSYRVYYGPRSQVLVAMEPSNLMLQDQRESFGSESFSAGGV
ncbi:MAG TPA: hypothetical protein VKU01_36570 [Bryobacteraceae bacterium]|nr:hypothetical protein [Bryobacteraceae bacterium]